MVYAFSMIRDVLRAIRAARNPKRNLWHITPQYQSECERAGKCPNCAEIGTHLPECWRDDIELRHWIMGPGHKQRAI